MSRAEVKSILSHIKDDELRADLADIFRNELLGSRPSRAIRPIRDVGRLRH